VYGSWLPWPVTLDRDLDVVLLDLDGTLSEAGPAIVAAVALALEHVGLDPLDEARLRAFVGPPLEDSFAALPGMDDHLVQEAVAVYRASYDLLGSPLYEGVVDALSTLRAAGLRLALATSKPQPFAEQVVAAQGLGPLLEVVVGSDRPAGRRTKGDVVAEALRRMSPYRSPVMVGDREHDVLGAAEHGVPCVGVLWGYGDAAQLERAGAAAVVRSPAELAGLLVGTEPGAASTRP